MSQHHSPTARAERIDVHQLEQAMPLAIERALAARRVGETLSDAQLQAVSGGLPALLSLGGNPLPTPAPVKLPAINGGLYIPAFYRA